MIPVGVYLGGEGPNELGSYCGDPIYRDVHEPGVIETLLRHVQATGWEVIGATKWSQIRKLKSRGPSPREEQNVLGLVLETKRKKAQALAFVRDADDDNERPKVIDAAIRKAREQFPDVEIIGGAAIPVLEAWILALLGEQGTEKLRKAQAEKRLEKKGIARKDTRAMVKATAEVLPSEIPEDARTLRAWLTTAQEVLPRLVREAAGRGDGNL